MNFPAFLLFVILSPIPRASFGYQCEQNSQIDLSNVENGDEIAAFVDRSFAISLPVNYSHSCSWHIKVPDGKFLSFQLTRLNLHWCRFNCRKCSRVAMFDSNGNQILSNQCASSPPVQKFNTKSNKGSIVFTVAKQRETSDFFSNYKQSADAFGFSVKIHIGDSPVNFEDFDPCNETFVISAPIGTFGSIQSYVTADGKYRANENCKWLIQSTDPRAIIRFSNRYLDTEDECGCARPEQCWEKCTSDYLTVFNGNETLPYYRDGGKVLSVQCGAPKVTHCVWRSFVPQALVVFTSDHRVEFTGFILDYEILSHDRFPYADSTRCYFQISEEYLNPANSKSGVIESYTRQSNGKYRPNERILYLIDKPENQVFSFNFSKFLLDENCHHCDSTLNQCQHFDYVAVGSKFCFCGRNVSLKRTFYFNKNNAGDDVMFTANAFDEYEGFKMHYEFGLCFLHLVLLALKSYLLI